MFTYGKSPVFHPVLFEIRLVLPVPIREVRAPGKASTAWFRVLGSKRGSLRGDLI